MFKIVMPANVPEDHYNALKERLKYRIEKQYKSRNMRGKVLNSQYVAILEWFRGPKNTYGNLRKIITAKPEVLMDIYQEWKTNFQFTSIDKNGKPVTIFQDDGVHEDEEFYTKKLKNIFNYNDFIQTKPDEPNLSYELTQKLGVTVCPYCNRQFVFSVKRKKTKKEQAKDEQANPGKQIITTKYLIRPELDHYFPKSRFPMFALSVYNLIPSCHICNSNLKRANELSLDKNYHPYVHEDHNYRFHLNMTNIQNTALTIQYPNDVNQKAENTFKFFELDTIYPYHTEESDRITELFHTYYPAYLDEMYNSFKQSGIQISRKKLLEIIYNHYVVKNPDNEILGNMRDDLYKQILEKYKGLSGNNRA